MKDSSRTKEQLIEELTELRIKFLKLEKAGSGHGKTTGPIIENDDRYRLLISSIPYVTWISDVSGNTSFISRNVEKVYGFTAEEVQEGGAELWFGRVHPDDKEGLIKKWQAFFEEDIPFDIEYRIQRKDGEWIWLADKAVEKRDRGGTKVAYGIFTDISAHKRIEEELRFNEERFRALSLAAFEGIVFSKDGVLIDANQQCADIVGYEVDELIGLTVVDLISPVDRELVMSHVQADVEGPPYELRARSKNGEIKHLEVRAKMMTVNGESLRVTAVRDITEIKTSKKAMETLYKSIGGSLGQKFFDGVVDSLYEWLGADCVIVGERYGEDNIRALSMKIDGDKVEDFSYALPDTPCAKVVCKDDVCFYPEDVTGLFPFDEDLAQMGAVGYIGISLKGRDGALIGVLCALTKKKFVLPPNAEEVLKLVAARASAELERMRAEQEVVRLNESLERQVSERTAELRAVNKELEAFAYSVSHDLRAPLRGIDGFSQALLEDYGDSLNANAKDYLNRIHSATQHMNELITDLLSLSKVTCSELRRESVDMTALVEKVVRHLKKIDTGRGVETVVAGGVVVEKADSHMVRVIFDNLIGNAWKFTSKKDSARIEFGELDEDGERVFFIRDNGAGFNMAYIGKLFGAFQRLHSVKEFKGTGIGLATVQRIVGRHGGRVWAEAEPGVGATFYFTLS